MIGSARAEIRKLARILDVPDDRLAALAPVPAADIRAYRERVTDLLFDADAARLRRVAEASRLLPARLAASIAHRVFGPLLAARLTGALDPGRAIAIAEHLPDGFLAEVAAELDPRRAVRIVRGLPTDRTVAACREMAARDEHVAMGRFVGHLDDAALAACVDVLSVADLALVATAFDGDVAVDRVVALVPDEDVPAVVEQVARLVDEEEAPLLVDALGADQQARVAALLAGGGAAVS